MKATEIKRSEWQLWLPLVAFLIMAAASFYTLIAAMLWTGIGFIVIKLKHGGKVGSFGNSKYRQGIRKLALVTYHICWWPAYLNNKV